MLVRHPRRLIVVNVVVVVEENEVRNIKNENRVVDQEVTVENINDGNARIPQYRPIHPLNHHHRLLLL